MFNKEIISFDIGVENIKIVIGKQQGNTVILSSIFMISTPANAVQDGKIIDTNKLIETIGQVLKEKKIKAKKAVVTIESTNIIRREIVIPMVKPEEMDTMVKYESEQYLPIVMSDYIIEYKIIDEFLEDQLKKCRILVAALPKAIAEDYLMLIRALNLTPLALDLNSNALSKLFGFKNNINGEPYNVDKTVAIMDIGYRNINLTILSKGNVRFSRLIDSGGFDVDINIANSFNLEMNHAEEKKIKEVNLMSQAGESLEAMLNDAAKSTVNGWLAEIERMFQYYTSRDTKNHIDAIYLYGGSSNLTGLAEHIKSALNMPTRKLENFGSIKSNMKNDIPMEYYFNSIGAVIRR